MFPGRDSLCRSIADDGYSFLDGAPDACPDFTLGLMLNLNQENDSDLESDSHHKEKGLKNSSTGSSSSSEKTVQDKDKGFMSSSTDNSNSSSSDRRVASTFLDDGVASTLLDAEASQTLSKFHPEDIIIVVDRVSCCNPRPPKLRRMCKHIDSNDLLEAGC